MSARQPKIPEAVVSQAALPLIAAIMNPYTLVITEKPTQPPIAKRTSLRLRPLPPRQQLHQRRRVRLAYRREPKLVLRIMLLHQIMRDLVCQRKEPVPTQSACISR